VEVLNQEVVGMRGQKFFCLSHSSSVTMLRDCFKTYYQDFRYYSKYLRWL